MQQQPEPQPEPKVLPKGLQAAREAREARLAAGLAAVPPVRLNPLEKLAAHPTSLRASINAKCYQCEGEDADPKVRHRIGSCLVTSCGLWAVRPYQHMSMASDDGDQDHDQGEADQD